MSSNCPCFLLQLTLLECFMFHVSKHQWSSNSHYTHYTSFESRLLFTLRSLGLSLPDIFRVHLRITGRSRAGLLSFFVFRFQFRFFSRWFLSLRNWRRDSILRPPKECTKECCAFFPNTTVPSQIFNLFFLIPILVTL